MGPSQKKSRSEILNKEEIKEPKWLAWAREIYSLSQSGLTYSKNEFDLNRCCPAYLE